MNDLFKEESFTEINYDTPDIRNRRLHMNEHQNSRKEKRNAENHRTERRTESEFSG
jgi:hypothetical protein